MVVGLYCTGENKSHKSLIFLQHKGSWTLWIFLERKFFGYAVLYLHILCTGVYLALKGVVYANNSVIPITEIGETDITTQLPPPNSNNGLQCITDRMPCCASPPNWVGQWQFPNKTNAGIPGTTASFYRNRGDDGTVNLNRVDTSVMMPTGQFCCIVPDASGVNRTVCANIGECYD